MLNDLTPLEGGWSGETFSSSYGGQRVVVRVLPPGRHRAEAAEILAALHHLVRGLLPVPDVLEVRRGDVDADLPGLLVTGWVPGERGDLVLPSLETAGRERLGRAVGDLAGRLGGMPMPRAGSFVDADLTLGPLPGPGSLAEWVDLRAPAMAGWSEEEIGALAALAEDAEGLLDTVSRRCLVHSDLNPKNLLVDPATLEITGLVDWEFAHAGHPATDLGNLLRFDRDADYVRGVLAGYTARLPGDPERLLDLARAADLWALVDLAARAGSAPSNPVAQRAALRLRTIVETRDWQASG